MCNRHVPTVLTVQINCRNSTVQVQFLEVADLPAVVQRQAGVDVAITRFGGA